MYELVVFDVAGTIVKDDGVVISAFKEAFAKVVPITWHEKEAEYTQYAIDTMGRSKIEVFKDLLIDESVAKRATEEFENAYLSKLAELEPVPGVEKLFDDLKSKGIKIALNTGFNRSTLDTLLSGLGWSEVFDFTATPTETGFGRPEPDMIRLAASSLGVSGPAAVVVIGDTVSDIEAGINYSAGLKVGVLSGAHTQQQLLHAGADVVVDTVVDSYELITGE